MRSRIAASRIASHGHADPAGNQERRSRGCPGCSRRSLDKLLQRLSRGRWSILRIAGLPNLMLTVVGRRSGVPRSTPLLCIPYGDGQLVAGSNFGGAKPPVWVVNVRAADTVTVSIGGRSHRAVARELTGEERAGAWEHMLETWPNYARYAARTDRVIPVFLLTPAA